MCVYSTMRTAAFRTRLQHTPPLNTPTLRRILLKHFIQRLALMYIKVPRSRFLCLRAHDGSMARWLLRSSLMCLLRGPTTFPPGAKGGKSRKGFCSPATGDFFFVLQCICRRKLRWLKSSVSTKSSVSSRWTRLHGALRKVEPVNHLLEVVSVRTGKKHF